MEWKDTVMSQTETTKYVDRWLNGDIEARHVTALIAEAQAEISFKVGVKEVLEWIGEQGWETFRTGYYPSQETWKAQKKEWGIKDD